MRARAHGARLLQVPGRVLQGLNPVPGGGGKSERVGERGAEEKTHLRGEKKLRGHFLSFPPSRTGRRSSDEYLKWNSFSKDGLSSATLVSEIYFYQLSSCLKLCRFLKPLVRVLPKPAKECTGRKVNPLVSTLTREGHATDGATLMLRCVSRSKRVATDPFTGRERSERFYAT